METKRASFQTPAWALLMCDRDRVYSSFPRNLGLADAHVIEGGHSRDAPRIISGERSWTGLAGYLFCVEPGWGVS
jgi:hypothetical protein